MTDTSAAARFKDMHDAEGCFVMPNAWDAGSARILAGMGFEALGTTSAGLAYSRGHEDSVGPMTIDHALENIGAISAAVAVPVSADYENGYAHDPEDVAANIRRAAGAGAAGASIEDFTGDRDRPLYDIGLATERIAAAAEAVRGLAHPFVLCARAECYLVKHEDAFGESMKRLQAYAAAGAGCVYSPGAQDRDQIKAFCLDAGAPVNVLVGIPGMNATLDEMRGLGVRRLSTGGSLMRATLGPLIQAAKDIQDGRFPFPDDAPPDADVVRMLEKGAKGGS